jgi:hypothetical protein
MLIQHYQLIDAVSSYTTRHACLETISEPDGGSPARDPGALTRSPIPFMAIET